ncbi:lipopolysaccharide biosynthesis protein [Georgenia sp. 10Sc9-8]|uniref:Lipopolysaccharide biosynthesis protein n=1 Tax=Georgenia halotolerans TaxID=3028317 RepID=A0ABT5U052_9MICO|nr:lipopolysaccharide biosynthesis protein [Georgenia halotolerans]
MSLSDAAARGAGVTLATQAVRIALQFGSMVVLARLLSPEDFGLIAMVTAVIGIADLIRDFGLSSAAIQAKTLTVPERDNLFWLNSGLGLVCGLIAVAASPLIVGLYGEPRLAAIVPALATVFFVSGLNTQYRAGLSRELRFGALAGADIVSQLIGIAVAVGLAVDGWDYWAIVAQQVVVAVIALIANSYNCRWLPGAPNRKVSVRRFMRFGGGLLGTQVISYATKNIDNVLLGAVWGAGALGLYSRAYQLLMMPLNQINAPMTRVALPVLSRIQDDGEQYSRYLQRAQLVACYVTATVFAVACVLAEPLTLVLFGEQWLGLAPIFAVLALGGVFRALVQIAYWIYLSKGRTGAQLRLELWVRPLMIGVIAAGLPWGAVGIAAGHSVAYFGYWAASFWAVGRDTGVRTSPLVRKTVSSLLLVSLPAAAGAYLITLLDVAPLAVLVLGSVTGLTMVGLIALVVPAVREDFKLLYRFARRAAGGWRRRA